MSINSVRSLACRPRIVAISGATISTPQLVGTNMRRSATANFPPTRADDSVPYCFACSTLRGTLPCSSVNEPGRRIGGNGSGINRVARPCHGASTQGRRRWAGSARLPCCLPDPPETGPVQPRRSPMQQWTVARPRTPDAPVTRMRMGRRISPTSASRAEDPPASGSAFGQRRTAATELVGSSPPWDRSPRAIVKMPSSPKCSQSWSSTSQ